MDTAPAPESNPCLSCGVCCTHFRISFYHGEVDDMPSGFVPSDMVEQLTPFRACMKGTNQSERRCVALAGTLGVQVFCTIYEYRPTPCREFEVWNAAGQPDERCQQLRIAYGLAPLPALAPIPVAEPVTMPEPIPVAANLLNGGEPDGPVVVNG